MKDIYIFSGLGADERIFRHLDFSGFKTTFIQWIEPQDNETIKHYAKRLTEQIKTKSPLLIGLSFGGLMAIEVAKQISTEKVILISSAKTQYEIPFYYRIAGQLRLHRLLPARLLKQANIFTYWFFGAQRQDDKQLLKNILCDTNTKFLKWAINKIVTWKNQTKIENLKHIHGTGDKILPLCFVQADRKVSNGGHLMLLNKADEITNFIAAETK